MTLATPGIAAIRVVTTLRIDGTVATSRRMRRSRSERRTVRSPLPGVRAIPMIRKSNILQPLVKKRQPKANSLASSSTTKIASTARSKN